MKLSIEELAREADLDHAEPDHNCRVPYFDMVTVKELEAFASLIVERCAAECDGVYYENIGPAHGEVRYGVAACASAIRKLLEAE